MITHRTKWLLAGLLCLAFWPAIAHAQEGAWDRHMRAADAAYLRGNFDDDRPVNPAAANARLVKAANRGLSRWSPDPMLQVLKRIR